MHIFPEDQVDENFFDLYYHPYKKQIWGVGAVFAVAVVSFLGVRQVRQNRLDEQWSRYEEALRLRSPALPGDADPEQVRQQVDALESLLQDAPDAPVAPWALKAIVSAHVAAGQHDQALADLDRLQTAYPEFALNTLPAGPDATAGSLADHLRATIESEKEWLSATEYVHTPPPDDRIALIDTNLGTLQIGFYASEAPDHVEAFVTRAKRGDYNGTQFYEVRLGADGAPQLVRGGSSASKTERDPALHDRDEPSDTIEPGDSRYTIRHHFGVVSAVEMDSGESATNFQIITAPDGMSRFDGQNTPYGAILDRGTSLETLQKIARATTYGTNPDTATADGVFRMRDHPYPPVLIRRVAILTNEKVEEGHDWDTSRIGTDEPEPWEADLEAPPLPDEFGAPRDDDQGSAPGDGTNDESGKDETSDEAGDDEETPGDE